jgi:membrane-bound lytic murein transglycosylase A
MAAPLELNAASLKPLELASLQGWAADGHQAALETFRRSCSEIIADGRAFARPIARGGTRQDWLPVCEKAMTADNARSFFESEFTALAVEDSERPQGLFTGYYEPEAEASLTRSEDYNVPIYGRPADLLAFDAAAEKATGLKYGRLNDGRPQPYFTRREIEEGALAGRNLELVWLKDWADAFFIHIQGSGRARLADGRAIRLAYAAKSGQPYTGIGRLLVDRGVLTEDAMSMQNLRSWMAKNPEAARRLMWENRSFIFFRIVTGLDEALGAPGAQQVQLTPLRSLAVDRSIWAFGTPVWLDADVPSGRDNSLQSFRHLMIAQDTGTAIRGAARGDVYWGWGEHAAATAGAMKSPGRMVVLLPKPLAKRLTGTP